MESFPSTLIFVSTPILLRKVKNGKFSVSWPFFFYSC